jgi:hypothetical protein
LNLVYIRGRAILGTNPMSCKNKFTRKKIWWSIYINYSVNTCLHFKPTPCLTLKWWLS